MEKKTISGKIKEDVINMSFEDFVTAVLSGVFIGIFACSVYLNDSWEESLVDSGHAYYSVDKYGCTTFEIYPSCQPVEAEKPE